MSAERPVVWLVRHGETSWNLEGRMQGHTDVALTDRGRAQAMALAERLRSGPPARIVSSDLARALATARIVGAACGVEPVADAGLREQDLGAWEGKTFPEVERIEPDVAARFRHRDPDARPMDGETRGELAARVWATFETHAASGTPGPLLVVSHGGALQTVLYRVLGLPLTSMRRFTLPNAALSTLVWRRDGWFLRTLNDLTHLAGVSGEAFPFE